MLKQLFKINIIHFNKNIFSAKTNFSNKHLKLQSQYSKLPKNKLVHKQVYAPYIINKNKFISQIKYIYFQIQILKRRVNNY